MSHIYIFLIRQLMRLSFRDILNHLLGYKQLLSGKKSLKFRLIKRLIENEADDATIYALFDFINIYLPFGDKEKSLTFERELDLLIDKDNDMEAVTIRDFYIRKVREQDRRIAQKEIKAERKIAEEEARMRQEEAQRREEAENKFIDVMFELHNQGFSIEKIATIMRQSEDFVQNVMNKNNA